MDASSPKRSLGEQLNAASKHSSDDSGDGSGVYRNSVIRQHSCCFPLHTESPTDRNDFRGRVEVGNSWPSLRNSDC